MRLPNKFVRVEVVKTSSLESSIRVKVLHRSFNILRESKPILIRNKILITSLRTGLVQCLFLDVSPSCTITTVNYNTRRINPKKKFQKRFLESTSLPVSLNWVQMSNLRSSSLSKIPGIENDEDMQSIGK